MFGKSLGTLGEGRRRRGRGSEEKYFGIDLLLVLEPNKISNSAINRELVCGVCACICGVYLECVHD